MGNTFGRLFRVTTFGESHGRAIGAVIDGCPAGVPLDAADIQGGLDRRRPGRGVGISKRQETDRVEILSGLNEGHTLGTPITLIIANRDAKSSDYKTLREVFRPGHADLTWWQKFGTPPQSGGGRSSGRETAARVAAGAVASAFLRQVLPELAISAEIAELGGVSVETRDAPAQWEKLLKKAESEGDSLGGVVSCRVDGCPAGLGEPVFDKLQAELGKAMLSIPGCRAFGVGEGFAIAAMRGSTFNDPIESLTDGTPRQSSNNAAGIQGGISNGQTILIRCAFRPPASIQKSQRTIAMNGTPRTLAGVKGRHDACYVPRVLPVVEAMAALTLADMLLRHEARPIRL